MSSHPAGLAGRAGASYAGGMASSRRGQGPGEKRGRTRADRLKAALRENLKRRKAQAAARQLGGAGQAPTSHDSAGFVQEIERAKPKG
jgi:hypothetical protein